ncbi:MAG: hypothetical protein AW10_03354 [Candidatus Accumulibacter appositus]|uniref:Uncharacterized protein n=1 Tax=Candidatus Accumulibacter appositus TaxID=1454003 RepID=A0A011NRY9_9PROT|nr:MAG: hypothetical protein AW10_03354 [Candidatus Accumulibacter appositus]HRD92364.1 hypothetical protein [Accumulibacter sp.]
MLAERSVRRLSIRAPADALVRRAGFLIEDALRTASLPGDGAEVLLLRRLRLPPFTTAASPQQVALRLEAACRAAIAVDGTRVDDATLAAAPAVRFADNLTAHLSLTVLVLAGAARQAWCWPLLVQGYRPALGRGGALRALALSLAALPEAPAALPRWLALLVADGGGGCAELLLALQGDDLAPLQAAARGARKQTSLAAPARWESLLDWSAGRLGVDDVRHRWLLDIARLSGMDVDRRTRRENGAASRGAEAAFAPGPKPRHPGGDGGDEKRVQADPAAAAPAAQRAAHGNLPAVVPVASPSLATARESRPAAAADGTPLSAAAQEAGVARDRSSAPAADHKPAVGKVAGAGEPVAVRSETAASAANSTLPAPAAPSAGASPATGDQEVVRQRADAATAAGGLLFLVPLLNQLGLGDVLGAGAVASDLPQRLFAILLRRLPIADDDPLWLLCVLPLAADCAAHDEAVRWLARCRRQLRRHVGIGLYSLVCRPARIAITATHVDIWQAIDAVDLRVRRAGLDIDPGWVPWLGRVLRFHYGRDDP